MEHGDHSQCSFDSSQKATLPMGHSLFTPQLLLRSIQHQSSSFNVHAAARDHSMSKQLSLHGIYLNM